MCQFVLLAAEELFEIVFSPSFYFYSYLTCVPHMCGNARFKTLFPFIPKTVSHALFLMH